MQELQTQQHESRKPLIDFDHWAELARTDPQAFEAERARLIDATIRKLPEQKQQRMRCLQWKIDQVRDRAANPMAACIKLSEMMWDSLVGPGGLKDALEQLGNDDCEPLPRARVVEFTPRA